MGDKTKRDFYSRDARPIVVVIAVILILLAFYIGLLGVRGVQLLQSGSVVGIGLGVGVLILPFLGVWMAVTTVRAGIAHQRLGRRMREEGLEVDVSDLPRRPSGRLERDSADELFATIKTEWEADPASWRNTYRIARAYDFAGDRSRAREMMKRAVAQEKADRAGSSS